MDGRAFMDTNQQMQVVPSYSRKAAASEVMHLSIYPISNTHPYTLGGMRHISPEPAFRTDYSFAGLSAHFGVFYAMWSCGVRPDIRDM